MEAEKYKAKRYVVSAGNIGSIEFSRLDEAIVDFDTYVQDSKDCYGRVSQEDVILLMDGEPVQSFIWREWRIEQQKAKVIGLRTDFEKALIVLNRFLEGAEYED